MTAAAEPAPGIPFAAMVAVWARVAALSFGGPAGQIAVMHRIVVDEKRWVGDRRFLHALNYCMLLPGPEAHQLAIYLGWLMHGVRGGVVAGVLFVLPGFLAIMALSAVYVAFGPTEIVTGIFFGLKAAVLAIVLQALVRIARRALGHRTLRVLALGGLRGDLRVPGAVPADRAGGGDGRLVRRPGGDRPPSGPAGTATRAAACRTRSRRWGPRCMRIPGAATGRRRRCSPRCGSSRWRSSC